VNSKNNLAPIVLFVYNRPWHTQQTLDALAKNTLALDSELIVFCDGPKEGLVASSLELIEKTREIVKGESRFHSVQVIESKENKGLADSIIGGVTEVVNQYGKIIVLEDDLITSPGFLQYMNDALWLYENEPRVMHISGFIYPVLTPLPETFFIKPTSCWGWGTWKRAWDYFKKDVDNQIEALEKSNAWSEFTFENSYLSYKKQLFLNKNKEINTWAIFWQTSVFLNNGLSLHPYPSLVQNIGFDGSGVHCAKSTESPYFWMELAPKIRVKKIKQIVTKKNFNTLTNYFFSLSSQNKKLSIRDKFYLWRKEWKNYINTIFKVVLNYKNISISEKQLNLPKADLIPRYQKGNVSFLDKEIEYIDFASFESTKNELFGLRVYEFKTLKQNPKIIDCGANIGLSILFFKELYPNATVLAFEADPNVFKCLENNVANFEYENVELINKALWDSNTTLSFYAEGGDGGRVDENSYENGEMITVETTCLSEYINDKIDFLKIDIEGAETKVLEEISDKLHLVQNIFIEYHSFTDKNQTLSIILEILSENNFRYYISNVGVRSSSPFVERNVNLGMDNQLNIFGYKKFD